MNSYQRLLLPLLEHSDPETAHNVTLSLLEFGQWNVVGRFLLRRIAGSVASRPVNALGLRFRNCLGVAAGFDKDARVVSGLNLLGFGHVEVGTLTPCPQEGNPRPRLFRASREQALANRMGFPNRGTAAASSRLAELSRRKQDVTVGVSLGKQRDTPLELAADDYCAVMESLFEFAHYFTVNISSPNTPGLRSLQARERLTDLLQALIEKNLYLSAVHGTKTRPLLLKISPDLAWRQLDEIISAAIEADIAGLVATNTTTDRTNLTGDIAAEQGGVSGRPLAQRSNDMIRYISRHAGPALTIIGAGGVFTAEDVKKKLNAGATLVQMYTGLVYGGPGIAGQILRQL